MNISESRFHFIGIGGAGMSGLAKILKSIGASVSGSDLVESSSIQELRSLDISIHIGHKASYVDHTDVVVYSSAIPRTNPEIQRAKFLKIPVIARAEVLAEIMRIKRGIGVAGTHGKTTTTSLIATLFIEASLDPSVVVGGRLEIIKSHARLGQGEWLIAETDESDGSFLLLNPEIAVITNIDKDHLEYYATFENLKKTFLEYARRISYYGCVIACGDDPHIREIFQHYDKRLLTYGFADTNDFIIKGKKRDYVICSKGQELGSIKIPIPGQHNALNTLAAMVVGMECGLSFEQCAESLQKFQGVSRRFQKIGEYKRVQVFDDYGHHPTEIKAVLQACREEYPEQRIVVAFQPHRYTRTKECWDDFLTAFDGVDLLCVWDIYPALESPIEGVHAKNLTEAILLENKKYLGSGKEAVNVLKSELKPNDIFITLGAGDIFNVSRALVHED